METEEWKIMAGINEMYSISSFGKVINNKTGRYRRLCKDTKGYLRVGLMIEGKMTTRKVHRLVATYYVENPLSKPEVNHDDGNKANNHYNNLIWATGQENMQHAYFTGLKVVTQNQRDCGRRMLVGNGHSNKAVINIETKEEFKNITTAAKSIGYSRSGLSGMLTGFRKNHTPIRFKPNEL